MKKIFMSVATIATTATIAIGATQAYFTSEAKISSNTFATGTLKLEDASDSWMTNVNFQNLKPGDHIRKWVVLKNIGTLDIASLKVSAINKTDSSDLLDQIRVAVYAKVEGFDQGIYTPDWAVGKPVNEFLNDVNILGKAVYRDSTAAHVLSPTKKDTIILDFFVPTTLGNDYQGATASFDLQFEGEQSHTPDQYF